MGFDLEHIEAAEGKYLQQLNVLQQLDSDIKFSDVESEEDSEGDDTVLAEFVQWSDHLRPINIVNFTGPNQRPTTVMTGEKRELDFFNLIFELYANILMREFVNHQIQTKNNKERTRTQMEFRMKLDHQLLQGFMGKRKRTADIQPPAQQQHWPVIMGKKKTCKMCAQNKTRTEPITGCEQCQVNLCIKCFKQYHRQKFPYLFQ